MRRSIPHLFADLTAQAEDFHSLTVEGQRRDNSQDMQRALAGHLLVAIATMEGVVGQIKHRLGGPHE